MVETICIHVEFYEKRIYGDNNTSLIVKVKEEGDGDFAIDETEFKNQEDLKNQFPTFELLLQDFFYSNCWSSNQPRVFELLSVKGNDGIYDFINSEVYNLETNDEE